jgi:phosphoglucomutase
MTSGSLDDLIRKWLLWDKDQTTAAEIRSLSQRKAQAGPSSIDAKDELEKRLQNRIQFGTAGLRGRMQAGFAFMNCLTVVQTSQGIAQYLVSSSSAAKPPSVLIGHDTRHNSARFARLAANAFRTKCINVHMFEDYVPTPFVAFGVKTLNADVGIMITASHNPAQDNGYKVYQSNGAQINTPVDEHIAQSILGNLQPWPGAWDESGNVQDPPNLLATVREKYVRQMLSLHHHVSCLVFDSVRLTSSNSSPSQMIPPPIRRLAESTRPCTG